jgi:hemoglobin-like flavoprotein
MKEQGAKLMKTIGIAVSSLTKLDEIVPVVQDLGKRHVGYGVTDSMYDTVGEALLWTLGEGLGDDFTEDTKSAWTETYVLLATVIVLVNSNRTLFLENFHS